MNKHFASLLLLCFSFLATAQVSDTPVKEKFVFPSNSVQMNIQVGATQMAQYLPLLKGKKVALVVNQTSVVGKVHLVDTLQHLGITIERIFAPEHGFRGDADAGAHIMNTVDKKTGIAIISLYGKKQKPTAEDLKDIDVVVFDIQDVGCRFYTFLSTLHYLLESCAENEKKLILLDRPNPNGYYVDGPILDMKYKSFVGVSPIPVVHGLTVGEYATMAVGEKWIAHAEKLSLSVILCLNYTHSSRYRLPIPPSPNLRNDRAVFLYPSLCFFEGTNVSIGRGTEFPFQVVGSPYTVTDSAFTFTPMSTAGATAPPYKGEVCRGYDLRHYIRNLHTEMKGINLHYLVQLYQHCRDTAKFFSNPDFFDKLAGTDALRHAIVAGNTAEDIRKTWKPALATYALLRKKYILYPDFEK